MVFRSMSKAEASPTSRAPPSQQPHAGIQPRRSINPSSSSSMLSASAHLHQKHQKQQQQQHQQGIHHGVTKMDQESAPRPRMVTRGSSQPVLSRSGGNGDAALHASVSSRQRANLVKDAPAPAGTPRPCTPPLPCPAPANKRQLAKSGAAMDTDTDEDASCRRSPSPAPAPFTLANPPMRQPWHDHRSTSSSVLVAASTRRPSTSSGSAAARSSVAATSEMRLRASSCGSTTLRTAPRRDQDDPASALEDEDMTAGSLADSNASSNTSLNVPRFSPAPASPPPDQVYTASTYGPMSGTASTPASTTTSPRRRGRIVSSASHHHHHHHHHQLHHHHQQHPRMHSTTPITTPLASMTSASSLDTSFNMDTEHDASDAQPTTPLEDPFSPGVAATPRSSLASPSAVHAPPSSWPSPSSTSSAVQAPAKASPVLRRAHEGMLHRRTASVSAISRPNSSTMTLPTAEQAAGTRPPLRRQASIKGGVSRPKPRASCFSSSAPSGPVSPSLSPRQHARLTLPTSPSSCPSTPEPKARRFSLLERRRERAMSWNEHSRGKGGSVSPTFLRTGSLQLKLPVSSINAVHNDEDTRLDDMKGERVDALFDAAVAMGEEEAAKLDTSFTDDSSA